MYICKTFTINIEYKVLSNFPQILLFLLLLFPPPLSLSLSLSLSLHKGLKEIIIYSPMDIVITYHLSAALLPLIFLPFLSFRHGQEFQKLYIVLEQRLFFTFAFPLLRQFQMLNASIYLFSAYMLDCYLHLFLFNDFLF